jgi:hypothetical protein
MNAGPSVHVIPVHLQIAGSVVTVHVTPVHLQIVPIVRHVHTVTETHAQVHARHLIVQQVVRTEIEIHVRRRAQLQIVPIVLRVHMATDQNVAMIVVHQVIVQPGAPTETVIHVLHQIVPIVRHVLMVIDQNAVMIAVQVPIDQQVVRTVIAIPVQAPVHLPIVVIDQPVVHMETATRVHLPIVHVVARRVDRQIDAMTVILDRAIHDPRQINPAEATHTVAIAHARAMIATHAHLRVTANAVADQIVPEAASPMIAKSVHAVALAKSA